MTEATTDRVADAPADIWVYRLLPIPIWPYAQLARWDRPIGWWLLLWPCWWSLALVLGSTFTNWQVSNNGFYWAIFYIPMFAAFWLGAVMMRGAGCTYNDFVDVDIDQKVARTASRPIPSGRVSRKMTVVFICLQALVGFICLVFLASRFSVTTFSFTFWLGLTSLAIVAVYPFAKRFSDWPQFVLGLAFSWGALMGWASILQVLHTPAYLLYAAAILWTIGYDTIYAHQDKEDDALIGVRSTARLFGGRTKPALLILYSGTILLLALSVHYSTAGEGVLEMFPMQQGVPSLSAWPSYLGLAIGSGHMLWQIKTLDINDPDNCLALFKSNKTFGGIIFAGLLIDIFV